jgi:hypothetical protein
MKQIIFAFGLLILIGIDFSCKPKKNLADIGLISELINETIKQDSLKSNVPINIQLTDYYLYVELQNISSNDGAPPPPRYINSKGEEPFEFDDFKRELKFVINYSTSKEDSLFVINQITTNKNIRVDTNKIDKRFLYKDFSRLGFRDKWKDKIYFFRIPILNKAKNVAIIEYDYFCVRCGHGREVILKKINNKWILVKSTSTWIN